MDLGEKSEMRPENSCHRRAPSVCALLPLVVAAVRDIYYLDGLAILLGTLIAPNSQDIMPLHIDLQATDDFQDAVHRAVQALTEGQLVVCPTETVYCVAASALHGDAVQRLAALKGSADPTDYALAIHGDDIRDYSPQLSPLAGRLARRCWPGPLTLMVDGSHADSAVLQLPKSVQEVVAPNGDVGLRVPGHGFLLSVLNLVAGPLVLTSPNNKDTQGDVTSGADALTSVGAQVAMVVDDGPCKFNQASTTVRSSDQSLEIVRPGVINESQLKKLGSFMVVFVCTGNTCRSPMAAALMRKRLAEKFGCEVSELEDHGIMVLSAGIAAMNGAAASPEAVSTMALQKVDLADHESQPLTERVARFADAILTMTRGHREAICAQWPEMAPRVHLLCHDGRDVSDPIGGPEALYEQCARQIDDQLEQWLATFRQHGLQLPN